MDVTPNIVLGTREHPLVVQLMQKEFGQKLLAHLHTPYGTSDSGAVQVHNFNEASGLTKLGLPKLSRRFSRRKGICGTVPGAVLIDDQYRHMTLGTAPD